jgi:hypothetical protein
MKNRNTPMLERLFIAIGLLLAILPLLFKEYIALPDYFRGCLAGFGIGLEFYGFIRLRRRGYSACTRAEVEA